MRWNLLLQLLIIDDGRDEMVVAVDINDGGVEKFYLLKNDVMRTKKLRYPLLKFTSAGFTILVRNDVFEHLYFGLTYIWTPPTQNTHTEIICFTRKKFSYRL